VALIFISFHSHFAFADENLVPSVILRLGEGQHLSDTAFVVDKAQRKLTVWKSNGNGIVKLAEYPSDLGKLSGPKIKRNDKRTPEGVYFLQEMKEGPGLNFKEYGVRAFTTDYPNLFDRRAGKTGDGIWLHAIPDQVGLDRGSRGCVVVRNENILQLSQYVKLQQTPVIVLDSVNYVGPEASHKTAKEVEDFVETWRKAWETEDIAKYMSFYDESFESNKMNKAKWEKYKSGLNERYQKITVSFSKPVAFEHKGQVILRTLQRYQSDAVQDFGEKTLYMIRKDNQLKIVAEEWKPVPLTDALMALVGTSKPSSY
jgi:murein L,D-transpeptidase YafK